MRPRDLHASHAHTRRLLKGHSQAMKKSTNIDFLGPETGRWGGGLPLEGVVVEKFMPSLESLSSLGFEERNLGCPGNFAGMSRTPGGVQKVCANKVCAHFSVPTFVRNHLKRPVKEEGKALRAFPNFFFPELPPEGPSRTGDAA